MRLEQPTPGRLESFSDGVIAVIITILVLDLKIPQANGLAGLVSVLPTLGVYLISFSFTGVYWVNHHQAVHRLKRVDALVLWANLGFLFSLSLLPFFNSYLIAKHMDSASTAVYAGSLLLTAMGYRFLTNAIGRNERISGHVPDEEERALIHAANRKAWLSLCCYALSIPLAYWKPWLSVLLTALVSAIWVIPNFMVISPAECRAAEAAGAGMK